MTEKDSERGKRASFDRRTGAVHGSGSGAGGSGNPDEDYDNDPQAGGGAPATDEAQHESAKRHEGTRS